jgi:DNA-damage-inducible protein D
MEKHKIAIFQKKEIRKTIYNDEWWFSVVDICGALTGSHDPGAYWRKLKQRLKTEGSEVVTNCHGLKSLKQMILKVLLIYIMTQKMVVK